MKKLLLAVAAIGLLAACTEVKDSVELQSKQPTAMDFGAYSARATKAEKVGETELKTSGFYVTGIYRNSEYLKNQVSYDADCNRFEQTGTGKKYWPSDLATNNISFYANNLKEMTFNAPDEVVIEYNNPTTSADQKDLVVASVKDVDEIPTSRIAATGSQAGCQDLIFKHALTKINFSFIGADGDSGLTYTVSAIKVKTKVSGDYNFKNGGWENLATDYTACDYAIVPEENNVWTTGEPKALKADMMVIPQTGDDDGKIACSISYKVMNGDTPLYDDIKEFTIPTTVGTTTWAEQKSFRYTLTLPVNAFPITFAVEEVKEWEDPDNVGIGTF